MPTYDYVCRACQHELEIFHAITAPARKKCPRCGKNQLERRIGAARASCSRAAAST
jgi:putative FmdB family regulatory protein